MPARSGSRKVMWNFRKPPRPHCETFRVPVPAVHRGAFTAQGSRANTSNALQMWVTGALFGASVLAARPVENTSLKIKNSATAPKIQHIKLIELNITSR